MYARLSSLSLSEIDVSVYRDGICGYMSVSVRTGLASVGMHVSVGTLESAALGLGACASVFVCGSGRDSGVGHHHLHLLAADSVQRNCRHSGRLELV